jgi:hypothetical protein
VKGCVIDEAQTVMAVQGSACIRAREHAGRALGQRPADLVGQPPGEYSDLPGTGPGVHR